MKAELKSIGQDCDDDDSDRRRDCIDRGECVNDVHCVYKEECISLPFVYLCLCRFISVDVFVLTYLC